MPPLDKIDTVVLAGGVNRIPLFEGDAPSRKPLLPMGGKPCIQHVLDALKDIPEIDRVCIVGPEKLLREAIDEPERYEYAPEGGSFGSSVFEGLAHFPVSEEILFLTADLPLLTSGPVADFLSACRRESDGKGRIFLSGVEQSRFTGRYHGAPKRCSRFRDLTVCHGNLVLLEPRVFNEARILTRERFDAVYRSRKKTLATCWAFGWPFALGYLLGGRFARLFTLERVLRTASRRFGVDLVPVVLDDPAVALDIDEPYDYEFARRILEGSPSDSPARDPNPPT